MASGDPYNIYTPCGGMLGSLWGGSVGPAAPAQPELSNITFAVIAQAELDALKARVAELELKLSKLMPPEEQLTGTGPTISKRVVEL